MKEIKELTEKYFKFHDNNLKDDIFIKNYSVKDFEEKF